MSTGEQSATNTTDSRKDLFAEREAFIRSRTPTPGEAPARFLAIDIGNDNIRVTAFHNGRVISIICDLADSRKLPR